MSNSQKAALALGLEVVEEEKPYKIAYSGFAHHQVLYPIFRPCPKYDQIVDYTNYRPDTEQLRSMKVTGDQVTPVSGMYDKDPSQVTPEMLLLRSGRLDRADVQKLQFEFAEKAKSEQKTAKNKAKAEATDKAISDALGIEQSTEDSR